MLFNIRVSEIDISAENVESVICSSANIVDAHISTKIATDDNEGSIKTSRSFLACSTDDITF